jgi:diguanylate cyclase (GGDEF)-like protein
MALRAFIERGKLQRLLVVLAGLALNGLIGIVDYYTGHELVISSLYLMPIALVAWFCGLRLGLGAALISGFSLFIVEYIDGGYPHLWILVANTVIRIGLFTMVVYVLVSLHRVLRRLEESSHSDSLTGAASSALFYDYLNKESDRLRRYGRPLTVAYLDLDGFKEVNDDFGHLEGDRVLRLVAECAKSRLRKTDTVARLGGDEFALLCPETDEEAARAMVEGVVERLGEEMNQGGWPVTFSIGVVTSHEAPEDAEELVKMADDLMYAVKLSTKNGVRYASKGCASSTSAACDEQPLLDATRG